MMLEGGCHHLGIGAREWKVHISSSIEEEELHVAVQLLGDWESDHSLFHYPPVVVTGRRCGAFAPDKLYAS